MIRFAETFPDKKIVYALSRQLSWTHLRQMIYLHDPLQWDESQPGEEPPLGLLICAGKSDEHVELLQLERSGIRVAEYLTELPPREVLERRLHEALRATRERFNHGLEAGSEQKRIHPINC
jgi:hypothetical protein